MENHASVTGWQKLFFLIQMLLTFGGRYNCYFWDTQLKILKLLNFNMLFQLVLTKFFNSELFTCLPKLITWSSHAKSLLFRLCYFSLPLFKRAQRSLNICRCSGFLSLAGFYLGFIVWGRSPVWPKATSFLGGPEHAPLEMFWNKYALRCNLVHFETQFEKCFSVCTDVVASGWFFRNSYLSTVMIRKQYFFERKLSIWGGGSFYPFKTLDRTQVVMRC